jgi:hypothetical protein
MTPLLNPHRMTRCQVCCSLVPTVNLPEHLLADARMLQLIKSTHPEWGRQECEHYLRVLCDTHHLVE